MAIPRIQALRTPIIRDGEQKSCATVVVSDDEQGVVASAAQTGDHPLTLLVQTTARSMNQGFQRSVSPQQGHASQFLAIGGLFLLSGIAGLVYEVVWFRILATTFGATGPALAATTAAFMAGLGVGSQLMGPLADRLRRPMLTYAALEALIAASALAIPFTIRRLERLQAGFFPIESASVARDLVQFLAIFAVLLIPTMLMGATLPVLSKAVVRDESHLGRRFAWVYGINTLGAACGAVLTGFVLIPELGLRNAVWLGVSLNVAAAAGAAWLRWSGRPSRESATTSTPEWNATTDVSPVSVPRADLGTHSPAGQSKVAWGVFLSGFVALAAQYNWTRSLIFSFDRLKNTTYSFSAVLAVTLVGLVVGSLGAYLFIDRVRRPAVAFAGVLGALGISVVASTGVLLTFPPLNDAIDPQTLQVDFPLAVRQVVVRTAWVMGLPTILMGAALPLAVRSVAQNRTMGSTVGRLYACNTWGAVLGAVVASYLITPVAGLVRGLIILGCVDVLAAVWIATRQWGAARSAGMLVPLIMIIGSMMTNPGVWSLQTLRPGERIVRYRDGTLATVCVIESEDGERRICVDDVPVAGTSTIMQTDQKSLAHWGMMLAEQPRIALTVGFGSGGASHSFLLHDQLQRLDCVEICPDVPDFADLLTAANHGVLGRSDDRYRIIFADARAFLRSTSSSYDVIVSDCTDLRYRSSANLYDLEYFQLCRDRLTETGCVVIWMPLGGLSPGAFQLTLRTFFKVYPDAGVFYLHNRWTHYVLLVGKRGPLSLDPDTIRSMLAQDDVREDLGEIGMTNPFKVAATFLSSARHLQHYLAGDELNTEDRPRLEFAVPKFDTGPWSAQRNLNALRRHRAPITAALSPGISVEDVAQLNRFHGSAAAILAAQEAERRFDIEAATRSYLAAEELTPEDSAIGDALEFADLRRVAEAGNPTAWLLLGRSQQLRRDDKSARDSFARYWDSMEAIDPPGDAVEQQNLAQAQAWRALAVQWREELTRQSSVELLK